MLFVDDFEMDEPEIPELGEIMSNEMIGDLGEDAGRGARGGGI